MNLGEASNQYASKTVKRYSALFSLPSHRRIIISLYLVCLSGGMSSFLILNPSPYRFSLGFIFGTVFFLFTLSSDLITRYICMKTDPIFNLRRCSSLSLFSCIIWLVFIFLGSVLALKNPNFWIKIFLLGFFGVLTLRLLVFSTLSFVGHRKVFVCSLLQPLFYVVFILSTGSMIGYNIQVYQILPFLVLSTLLASLNVFLFVFFVNRVGEKSLGVNSLLIFKAFMANWTEDLNAPLEDLLDKFGHESNVKLSLLAFRTKMKIKAMMVVPVLHPGPFKNVGSSQLPFMIQSILENKLQCPVSVPHGLSSHDLDLSSKSECKKIAEVILNSVNFFSFNSKATPFVRTQKMEAKASCQLFGNCALITLTFSPKTMEDLPCILDRQIVNEAERRGLSSAIVIDSHNCIEGHFNPDVAAVASLKVAAINSLEQALKLPFHPFEIGTAKVIPKEYTVKEGMGPGGITVIVMRVGEQKTAYVTVDGNNMVSGLREKILFTLREIDIFDGEVFTTDNHMVCGIVQTPRGYHPIGEVMDQEKLIEYVRQAAMIALNDLEPAEASWRTETISNVRVIGEKQIESLCLLAEETAKQAKKLAILLFPVTGTLLTTLLFLF